MFHDPISDLLTRIRNAQKQRHRYVDIPLSKGSLHILNVIQEKGFVSQVVSNAEKRAIRVFLKYDENRKAVVNGLKRVSKPGVRRYIGYESIPKVLGGMGIAILSTNKGILEGETAREQKVGGELLCYIW